MDNFGQEVLNDENVVVEQEVIEDVVDNEEVASDEVQEQEQQDNKNVPLDTFLQQKKRAKEAEKRLRELEEKFLSKEKLEKREHLKMKFKDKGYDDEFADLLADTMESYIPAESSKRSEDELLIEEIRDLSEYGGIKDALKYKDEIVKRVKNNGLTVEEAYLLASKTAPKVYESEVKTQVEQLNAAKRRNAQADKVLNSSSSQQTSVSLNSEERSMLEHLRKTQPLANWTAEKLKRNISALNN